MITVLHLRRGGGVWDLDGEGGLSDVQFSWNFDNHQNEWHYHVVTLDVSGSSPYEVRAFVDGVEEPGSPFSISSKSTATYTNTYIGQFSSSFSWEGSIDEVAIYNRTLTPSEISDQYDAGLAGHGYCYDPWSDCKMHYPQLPDLNGWDVFAMMPDNILADDFECTETGPITDLHFWGSWYNDVIPNPEGRPDGFHISFHADIPDPDGEGPLYSMPGELLWERDIFVFDCVPEEPSLQGWFEPPGYYEIDNHMQYFRYDIFFEEPYFEQTEGIIYWVDIAPIDASGCFWGWKTSLEHFNDDAVYWLDPDGWMELRDPITDVSLDMAFVITGEETPDDPPTACFTWVDADGIGPGTMINFNAGCSSDDNGIAL